MPTSQRRGTFALTVSAARGARVFACVAAVSVAQASGTALSADPAGEQDVFWDYAGRAVEKVENPFRKQEIVRLAKPKTAAARRRRPPVG